jgi:hypothetical protein
MMQLALMQKRVEEIDAEIAKDKERIRQWEDRIAVFFDEQLQRQSKALVEKMALLFERKALIESQIRRRGRSGVRKQPLRPTITILGDQVERLRHLRRGSVAIDSPLLSSPTHRGQHKRRESIFSSATEVSDASNARRDKEFRHHYIIQ